MIEDPLRVLGRDDCRRARNIAALQDYERLSDHRFTNVRDDVTGPVVEALRKELRNGMVFELRPKIAREVVMSIPQKHDVRDFQSPHDLGGRPIELLPVDSAYLDGLSHGFAVPAVHDEAIIDNSAFRITPNVSPKLLLRRDRMLHSPTGGL